MTTRTSAWRRASGTMSGLGRVPSSGWARLCSKMWLLAPGWPVSQLAPSGPGSIAMTEQLRKSMVTADATLRDAMRSLEESMSQIVLVVETDDRLAGVLTDGDIRRAI